MKTKACAFVIDIVMPIYILSAIHCYCITGAFATDKFDNHTWKLFINLEGIEIKIRIS